MVYCSLLSDPDDRMIPQKGEEFPMLKKKEYIYAAIAICFWGSTAAVAKLLLQELSTITVLFFNCITATLFLFVLNLCTGRLKQLKSLPVGEYLKTAALGLMGMFLYNLFLYTGLDRLQAQQACLFLMYSARRN